MATCTPSWIEGRATLAIVKSSTTMNCEADRVSSSADPVRRPVMTFALPGQARGLFTSSGTDSALITARDVDSGDVIPFRVQSVSTRIRFPDMADRW